MYICCAVSCTISSLLLLAAQLLTNSQLLYKMFIHQCAMHSNAFGEHLHRHRHTLTPTISIELMPVNLFFKKKLDKIYHLSLGFCKLLSFSQTNVKQTKNIIFFFISRCIFNVIHITLLSNLNTIDHLICVLFDLICFNHGYYSKLSSILL